MARKALPTDLRLLSKVSKLYYEQSLTQQEIAERLRLSRPKVSRLLQQAHAEGIVQITILAPPGSYAEVEQQLEARFGLKEVIVVEIESTAPPETIARELGIAASSYLQRTLTDGDVIGISWGTTLNAMVNALPPCEVENVHIVQLIGGLGAPEAEVHATDLCRRLAHLLNGKLTLISAPGIVNSLAIKAALLTDRYVQSAFDLFARINVAYVGIGVPTSHSVVMRDGNIMSQDQLHDLFAIGAVGDIALRFFDACGQPILSELDDLVIGISLEQLKQIERVVGIAGGLEKRAALCAVLWGQLVDVLITDHVTALTLLDCPACPG